MHGVTAQSPFQERGLQPKTNHWFISIHILNTNLWRILPMVLPSVRKTSICLEPTRRMEGRLSLSVTPPDLVPPPLVPPTAPSSSSLRWWASMGNSSSEDSNMSKVRSSGSSSERERRRERLEGVVERWEEECRE